MADLYEFPYREGAKKQNFPFLFAARRLKRLPEVEHSYTRFRVKLYPTLWNALEKAEVVDYEWISWQELQTLPFSSGHRRVLHQLACYYKPRKHAYSTY